MPNRIHILLVDDDIDDHDFCREALKGVQAVGIQLHSVYDGRQAIDYLFRKNSYHNIAEPLPDLIILDLNMPILDGWAVLKELRKDRQISKIPVYILTTSTQDEDRKKCEVLGCAGFFSKPPKLEELRKVLQQMLDNAASA